MFLNCRLWQLTEGVRSRIFFTVLVGVISSAVGIIRLALLGWLLALIYQGASFEEILLSAALIAGVIVLRGILEHFRSMLAHKTASQVQLLLRKRLYDHIASLGPAYFGMKRTGEVLVTLIEGVEQLETYFGKYLPQLFVAFITPLVIFALLAFWDLPLAALLLGFAWLTLLAPALFHSWDSKNSLRRQKAYANYAAEFLDTIQGLATLKAFGQGKSRGKLLAARAHDVYRSTMWVLATNSLTRGITDTGIAVGTAVILCYGAYRVQAGLTSIETLLIILLAGVEIFRPQRDMRALLHEGMMGLSAAQGILALLDTPASIHWQTITADNNKQQLRTPGRSAVCFEKVTFAYPGGRQTVHHDLTFRIAPGERIGFVGSSGAGKSTIMKLLLRFYEPDQGEIFINGQSLRTMTADELYRQMAVVSQDTYLFHGTVAENLRFGQSQASMAQIQHAARLANAHSFIEDLPDGYDTVIGERGIRLSGGQRQRIAIARALLRDAPILILDEALSAVDAENEAIIQQALDRLMEGRTTLIFAHRLSSIIGCERIFVLAQGQIVESGTHQQLINQSGYYRRLMASQLEHDAVWTGNIDDADSCPEAAPDATIHKSSEKTVGEDQKTARIGWLGVLRELAGYVHAYKPHLSFTFLFGVARVLAFIGVGIVGALIVAAVKTGQSFDGLLVWLAVLALAAGVLHWLESWLAHDMAFRMLANLRARLYAKLESLAPAFLTRRRSGDLVAMATHDVEMVEYFFAHTIAPAFVAFLVPTLVLVILGLYNGLLAIVLLPFLLLVGLSPFLFRQRIDALGSKARESLAELNAFTVDNIQGLHEIIAFQQVDNRRQQFTAQIQKYLAMRLPFLRDLSWQAASLEVATGLGGLAIVMSGAYLTSNGEISALLLPLLTLLALSAFLPVSEIAQVGRQLANTLGATRRLYTLQKTPVAVADGPGVTLSNHPRNRSAPAVEMDAVSFSYDNNTVAALQSVSFTVNIGSTTALVGPSGAGKTTIAHLLLRFWDPDTGSVRMQGHDLREYKLDDLRARIALVSQDTYLFNETLRENILMARPEADEQALNDAIRRAALADFIAAQPQGLDTPVGERGLQLSGGQRQRVSIARAFLKNAPIVILDEATSHLDAVSEAAVRRSLEDLMHTRTTIIIAHRLSTVRNADQIIVLQAGRVIETGNHEQLVAKRGLYQRLVSRQLATTGKVPRQIKAGNLFSQCLK